MKILIAENDAMSRLLLVKTLERTRLPSANVRDVEVLESGVTVMASGGCHQQSVRRVLEPEYAPLANANRYKESRFLGYGPQYQHIFIIPFSSSPRDA